MNLDWIFTLAGWLTGAVGLLIVLAALFRDHASGRRRCPKCWYNMEAVDGLMCPECGRTVKRERSLARTRRRPLLACLGLFIMIGAVPLAFTPEIRDGKLWRHVPDWAWLRIHDLYDERAESLWNATFGGGPVVWGQASASVGGLTTFERYLLGCEGRDRLLEQGDPPSLDADPQLMMNSMQVPMQICSLGEGARPAIPELVRSGQVFALVTLPRALPELTPMLIRMAEHEEDERHRAQAIAALGQIGAGDRTAVRALIRFVKSDSDQIHGAAASSLGAVGIRAGNALPVLMADLTHRDRADPRPTLNAIDRVGRPDAEPLVRLVHDERPAAARWAANHLLRMPTGIGSHREELIAVLRESDDAVVRKVLIEVVSRIPGPLPPWAHEAFRKAALTDPDGAVRLEAYRALAARNAGDASVDVLARALRDTHSDVRLVGAQLLRHAAERIHRDPVALAATRRAVADAMNNDPDVLLKRELEDCIVTFGLQSDLPAQPADGATQNGGGTP